MNKVQQEQFLMLKEVDRICRKHNIQYYLDGGTLLGAVRHKGFIPWDDDLDIAMNRENYEKFKLFIDELDSKYFYQSLETDPNYGLMFAKIRKNGTKYIEKMSENVSCHNGIFIDIFSYDDGMKNSGAKNFKKALFYRMLLLVKTKYSIETDTSIKKIELILLKVISIFMTKKFIINRFNKIINRYSGMNHDCYIQYSSPYFTKSVFERSFYDEFIEMEFEGLKCWVPKNYDAYLTFVYGDYMTPPPEDKRGDRHGIVEIDLGEDN